MSALSSSSDDSWQFADGCIGKSKDSSSDHMSYFGSLAILAWTSTWLSVSVGIGKTNRIRHQTFLFLRFLIGGTVKYLHKKSNCKFHSHSHLLLGVQSSFGDARWVMDALLAAMSRSLSAWRFQEEAIYKRENVEKSKKDLFPLLCFWKTLVYYFELLMNNIID